MKRLFWVLIPLVLFVAAIWWLWRPAGDGRIPVYGVAVTTRYPHDTTAFTEGLFFQNGALYEGTGNVGESSLRQTDLVTGRVVRNADLAAPYFGEGIVPWKDKIYQLTWKDQKGFIYNQHDFSSVGDFTYSGEGWGATHDDRAIIMSDGSATLRFLDPDTLQQVSTLTVTAGACPVKNLNELEWVDGLIYANIWQTNLIARIDPKTGAVRSFLDIASLAPAVHGPDDVANGIAWDAAGKRLFVTGKRWAQLYQVRVNDAPTSSEVANALSVCAKS